MKNLINTIKKNRLYLRIHSYIISLTISPSASADLYFSEYRLIFTINNGILLLNKMSLYKELDIIADNETEYMIDTILEELFKPKSIRRTNL